MLAAYMLACPHIRTQEFEKGLKSGEEAAVKAKEELAKKKGEKEEE